MKNPLFDIDSLFGLDKNHSLNSTLVKSKFVSECDNCGELAHDDECTEFKMNSKYVHLCPVCTDKRREECPHSEVL